MNGQNREGSGNYEVLRIIKFVFLVSLTYTSRFTISSCCC